MKLQRAPRFLALPLALLTVVVAMGSSSAFADTLELKDGRQIEGIIQKVEGGQVTVEIGTRTQSFSILDVTRMQFDTPHLPAGVPESRVKHFLNDAEAQELVEHLQEVNRSAERLRTLLGEIQANWNKRDNIPASQRAEWMNTKGRFNVALARYQEVLGDFYFHVLDKVEEYNKVTKEANQLYVGMRGVFNAGSPLVDKEQQELPLRKYVPANWYDTVFYRGYQLGYQEGYWGNRQKRDPLE